MPLVASHTVGHPVCFGWGRLCKLLTLSIKSISGVFFNYLITIRRPRKTASIGVEIIFLFFITIGNEFRCLITESHLIVISSFFFYLTEQLHFKTNKKTFPLD